MSELTLLADADERGRRYLAETAQSRVFPSARVGFPSERSSVWKTKNH
ncbi:hypothetical protein PEC302107_28420 [Pectobacterium araliae]|nr:hypothetical protein PEC302107_28420 [Pectobacterium carotovorum subsp. carotovorum]